MTVTFDAGPLVQPITAEALRGFRATSGRRLRRGVSWAWIGGLVLILGWWLVQFVMKVLV
ncbi:hypothetical protein [Microbacterium sp. GXS0129]|uniref:hypothetical protein n=1 Tax=Microbacterium sp. GXS0129 TaxID=3377836 RepID=UPI00383B4AE9